VILVDSGELASSVRRASARTHPHGRRHARLNGFQATRAITREESRSTFRHHLHDQGPGDDKIWA